MSEVIMRYLAIVEKRKNSWAAWVPDLRNCLAFAETEDEVKRQIQEAIEIHLEDLTEAGKPIPPSISRSEYIEVLAA